MNNNIKEIQLRLEQFEPELERLLKAFSNAEQVCVCKLCKVNPPSFRFEDEKKIILNSFYKLYYATNKTDAYDKVVKEQLESWTFTTFTTFETFNEWARGMPVYFYDLYCKAVF